MPRTIAAALASLLVTAQFAVTPVEGQVGTTGEVAVGDHALAARNVIEATVTNALEESIGVVQDLVIDRTGIVTYLVVKVSDDRNVLLSFKPLQFRRSENGKVTVFANMTAVEASGLPTHR